MGSSDFDEANRAAREHLERTRRRLRDGRETLARLHESIDALLRERRSSSE